MDSKVMSKGRLSFLLKEIEKEFDTLLEENNELKRKLATYENSSPNGGSNVFTKKTKQGEKEKSSVTKQDKKQLENRQALLPLQKSDMWISTSELVGHRDGVWEVKTCPWSLNRLGSASADRTARVWSLSKISSQPHYVYVGHSGSVNSIRFHPVERFACTSSGDKTCHLWKVPVATKKEILQIDSPSPLRAKGTKLWNPLLNEPSELEFDEVENENKLDVPVVQEKVETMETNISDCHLILTGHTGPVIAADWLSMGSYIASVSTDNSLLFWDAETGASVHSVLNVHEESNYFTNLNTDMDNGVLTSSTDGLVRLWDRRYTKLPSLSIFAHESAANSAVYLRIDEPNTIVTGGDDRTCKVCNSSFFLIFLLICLWTWDIRNCKQPVNTIRCSSAVNRFSISPLSYTFSLPMDDKRTKLCDISGNRLGNLRSHDKGGHTAPITSTAWSNDESVVYTSSFSRSASIVAWIKELKSEKRKKPTE